MFKFGQQNFFPTWTHSSYSSEAAIQKFIVCSGQSILALEDYNLYISVLLFYIYLLLFISPFSSKYNLLSCGQARATSCRPRASDPVLNMKIGTTVRQDRQTDRDLKCWRHHPKHDSTSDRCRHAPMLPPLQLTAKDTRN